MRMLTAFSLGCAPEPPPAPTLRSPADVSLELRSPLDVDWGCRGANRSPALAWTALADAPFVVLVVHSQPESGGPPRLHWSAWDLPAAGGLVPAGIRPGQTPPIQGLASDGAVGWSGPCDAPGARLRLRMEIWLLDAPLKAPPTLELEALRERAAPYIRGLGLLQIGPTDAISGP